VRGFVQRFALLALGRAAERRPTGKMLRRKKMFGIAADSPASGARFVGWRAVVQDLLIVKEPARIKFDKVLHELLTFTTDKNHDLPTRKLLLKNTKNFPSPLPFT
jgi:hypothetical protein